MRKIKEMTNEKKKKGRNSVELRPMNILSTK